MKDLPIEEQGRIIAALEKAGASLPCPRCGNKDFSLVGGYLVSHVQYQFVNFDFTNPTVPCAAVVCKRCGFLALHALGALGLLPPQGAPDGVAQP